MKELEWKDAELVSRRLKDDFRQVTRYESGEIEVVASAESPTGTRLILPDVPKDVRPPRGTRQRKRNEAQLNNKPWLLGLVEAIDAVDLLERSPLETKNRFSLIVLDSTFEIALKEFIVHNKKLFSPREFDDVAIATLFKKRTQVINVSDHLNLFFSERSPERILAR